jgi:glycosyltransferase involved in cell wall biosynthesis
MNKSIKVSVLMPAYNVEEYIGDAIQSVLNQTFTEFELIVVNNGSHDNTEAVVRSFSDPRIRLINEPQRGIAPALNTGLKHARCNYIARFDADDVCHPSRLMVQYHFMQSNPEYIIVGAACDYMDMDGRYIFTHRPEAYADDEIKNIQYKICPFIHTSVMYKRNIILENGGYCENAHSFEDHILWLKILKAGKACNLPDPLVKVRLNPASITIDEKWRRRKFTTIKQRALKTGNIDTGQGNQLLDILRGQDTRRVKEGAYYALLAKKFLWNNYKPGEARRNLKKALVLNWLEWRIYGLFVLSYMPENFVVRLYQTLK